MSDTSGSSNDTVEDVNMDSPTAQSSQTSNVSTPAASASVAPSSEHVQSMPGSSTATPMSTPGTPVGAGGVSAPTVFGATPTVATASAPSNTSAMTSLPSGAGAGAVVTPVAQPPAAGSAPGGVASGPGSPMTGIMTPSPAPVSAMPPAAPASVAAHQQQQQQPLRQQQQTTLATPSHPAMVVPGSQAPTPQAAPSTSLSVPAAPALPPPASAHTLQPQLSDLQKAQQLQQLAAAQAAAQERAAAAAAAAAASASASIAEHNLAVGAALQSRKEEELNRKDRTLAEFLPMMETYAPIIPDAVTDYYLSRTGFECEDVRIKRLLALAAQKFISDIATDAFQYCKVRQQSQKRAPGKDKKTVLTMEDLSDALGEYGINVKKSDYYL
ncbi:Transcription initiation factor TFIID subunit 10 [Actinomortierella ambigua]|nr:Transcription initiation factor TFIID subunit 10 [Actinomortierella ambigua]